MRFKGHGFVSTEQAGGRHIFAVGVSQRRIVTRSLAQRATQRTQRAALWAIDLYFSGSVAYATGNDLLPSGLRSQD